MIVNAHNVTENNIQINDLGGIIIEAGQTIDLLTKAKFYELSESDDLIKLIASEKLIISNSFETLDVSYAIKHISLYNSEGPKDRSGKLRVHQTCRKIGTRYYWTGAADNINNIDDIGNGERIIYHHRIGDPTFEHRYYDFNMVDELNQTWVNEGHMIWKDCDFDFATASVVSRTPETLSDTKTNFYLQPDGPYAGLIFPSAGNGNIRLSGDILSPSGGLVFNPPDDEGNQSVGLWDADWDSATKRYKNLRPTPNGDGKFNMFGVERVFMTFANKITLLGNGFLRLPSSDVDQFAQGMRFKFFFNTYGIDHEWKFACLITMHRART